MARTLQQLDGFVNVLWGKINATIGSVTLFRFTNGGGFTGTVTNSATTPTLALTLQNASSSQAGQLSAADWTTFNAKANVPTIATVSTTDATITTIATIAIPSNTTVLVNATVVARRTGGSSGSAQDGASYIICASYKNVAGTATEIGETKLFTAEDQAGWDVTFTPSSSNTLIQVTGATNNNVDWKVSYSTVTVT